jgi:hypothetical protein
MKTNMITSEKFQKILAVRLKEMTALFIGILKRIITYFEPGDSPIALLSSNRYIQVPYLTCIGDTIFTFAGRGEAFVLRPEYLKEDPESEEEYIVKDLHDRGVREDSIDAYSDRSLGHFKYVGCGNRLWEAGVFENLPGTLTDIPMTVILH